MVWQRGKIVSVLNFVGKIFMVVSCSELIHGPGLLVIAYLTLYDFKAIVNSVSVTLGTMSTCQMVSHGLVTENGYRMQYCCDSEVMG